MAHETGIVPEHDVARVEPHAKPLADRARKLEALPLGDLAQRVADGLARLRAGFGLEPRAEDPLSALFAALPGTEIARRGDDLERDVAAARAAALEHERAAADVERRSESLKDALRERSSDLAQALARADEATAAKRELEVARARIVEIEAERERAAGELACALEENRRIAQALSDVAADRANALAARSDAEAERERAEERSASLRNDLDTARSELETSRSQLDTARSELGTARSELETSRRELDSARDELRTAALDDPRAELMRAALDAADARAVSAREVEALDKAAHIRLLGEKETELALVRRECAELSAEIARVRAEMQRDQSARDRSLADLRRQLAERDETLAVLQRDLAWRRREMDAVRAESSGLRWRILGGELGERVARWSDPAEGEARP